MYQNHQRSPTPEEGDYPDVVYKYRTWSDSYHQDTLIKRELFLSSPRRFNDPFDCRIPIAYKLLVTDPQMALQFYERWVYTHFEHYNERQHREEVQKCISVNK